VNGSGDNLKEFDYYKMDKLKKETSRIAKWKKKEKEGMLSGG
jgi:hypothetical protein